MTALDRVEVQVPAEQVRVGDVLVIPDENDEPAESPPVERVILDAVPEFVYAFTPDQHPLPRATLIRVRRVPTAPPADTSTSPAVDPTEYAAVRDLALALADLQPAPGKSAPTAPVKAAADRIRKAKP